jgi:hypothetical protein
VAALTEISERSDHIQLQLNMSIASKLVTALNECSEYVLIICDRLFCPFVSPKEACFHDIFNLSIVI